MMNKEKFLRTELGDALEECVKAWDMALEERKKATPGRMDENYSGLGFDYWDRTCRYCQAQWEVFQIALKQFYGINYNFTRTDEYFGVVTEDESGWLIRFERQEDI